MFVERRNVLASFPKSSVGATYVEEYAFYLGRQTYRSYRAFGGCFSGICGATNMPLLRSLRGIFHLIAQIADIHEERGDEWG